MHLPDLPVEPVEPPVALFDLDATLADFDASMRCELAKVRCPAELSYQGWLRADLPDFILARRSLIKKQPGFWRNLARIERGFAVYQLAVEVGFQTHILTQGPRTTTSAWTEKAEWCREHVPEAQVTITQDKGLAYGRVLVDDWPPYIMRWLAWRPRGLVVMLDWPHNRYVRSSSGTQSTKALSGPGSELAVPFEHPNVFRFRQDLVAGTVDALKQHKALRARLVEARDRPNLVPPVRV